MTINKSFPPETAHHTKRAAALRGLARSVFINVVCTYLLYRLLEPHFHPGSLLPLALSGLLPLFSLAYGVVRHRSIDVIGLFAAEDIAVSSIALLLAHNAMSALVGRSLQNAVLGALFLCSVLIKRPIMLYVARQFITGNEASGKARFDQMAARSDAKRVYRTMTLIWSLVLFAKSVMSVVIALTFIGLPFVVRTLQPAIQELDEPLILQQLVLVGDDPLGGGVGDQQHEGLVVPAKPYYALYSYKLFHSDRFDLLGNSLAILTGIASPDRARSMVAWIEAECEPMRVRGELAVDLPPNLFPYILPHQADWRPRYKSYNRPGEYHNGGVWPFVCGFYVAACVAAGRIGLARRTLLALTELVKAFPGLDLQFFRGNAKDIGPFTLHAFEGTDLIVQSLRSGKPVEYGIARKLADGVYLLIAVDESDADAATQNKFCDKAANVACRVKSREAVLALARATAAKPHAGGGLALLMEH